MRKLLIKVLVKPKLSSVKILSFFWGGNTLPQSWRQIQTSRNFGTPYTNMNLTERKRILILFRRFFGHCGLLDIYWHCAYQYFIIILRLFFTLPANKEHPNLRSL